MGEVIPFPVKSRESDIIPDTVDTKRPKVATLVISDSVFALPTNAFKWPSAGPVDSRYEKALEEQKKKRNGS